MTPREQRKAREAEVRAQRNRDLYVLLDTQDPQEIEEALRYFQSWWSSNLSGAYNMIRTLAHMREHGVPGRDD